MAKEEKHFVLVHGSCHGAWCWYKVVARFKTMGHKVTALDLSASGINPKQVHEIHSFSEYAQPLMDFMASLRTREDGRVILVGHSSGGNSVAHAMERFPEKISASVFVAAVITHARS